MSYILRILFIMLVIQSNLYSFSISGILGSIKNCFVSDKEVVKQKYVEEADDEETFDLLHAAEVGDLSCLTNLLLQKKENNIEQHHLDAALLIAVVQGHFDCIVELLKAGAQVNTSIYGTTAFMQAVESGNLEITKLLIAAGAIIDTRDKRGLTSLTIASYRGDKNLVRILLDAGADTGINLDKVSAFTIAVSRGHLDVVHEFIGAGMEVDVRGENGWTALMVAASDGHVSLVRELLTLGAAIDSQSSIGRTALSWAAIKGQVETVKALLEAGVDVNIEDNNKFTPLIWAAFNGHREIVTALIHKGARIDAQTDDGKDALTYAVLSKNEQIVRDLLLCGANPNMQNEHGITPLMYAVQLSEEIVTMLLEAGADSSIKSNKGETASDMLEARPESLKIIKNYE